MQVTNIGNAGNYNRRLYIRVAGVTYTERKDGSWRKEGSQKLAPFQTGDCQKIWAAFSPTSGHWDAEAHAAGTMTL